MKKKLLGLGLLVGLLALVAGAYLIFGHDRLHSKVRREWKGAALLQVDKKARDPHWLESELLKLKNQLSTSGGEWFSENLILATNGDWIVCASKCSKEDWRIHDIFVGRGSDGKWYYSTFHFCKGKADLRMEEQSGSLAEFVQSYFLREFDGHSDACLNETWPPKN